MNPLLKRLAWPVGIAIVIGLYFSDNIRGYMRFKAICEKEAGLHVNQPLERDVGWTVRGGRVEDASFPIFVNQVAFVRYRNEKDGNLYDVYRVPKLQVGDPGYSQRPADISKSVIYEYRIGHQDLNEEVRMSARVMEFVDLRTSQIVATYKDFSFSKFNPNNTLLGAPSGMTCPEDIIQTDPKTGKYFPMKRDIAISSMFIQ